MAVPTDVMIRMIVDIQAGKPAPDGESNERRRLRERLTKEIRDIEAWGGKVDIPPEVP